MLKSSKGITLVALVITIIVLLILAGVTLSLVLRDGIITKSEQAVDDYKAAADAEEADLIRFEQKMDEILNRLNASSPASGS